MQATRQWLLQWLYNGTVDITHQLANIERGIQKTPALAAKVQKGSVNGNPHATPHYGQPSDRLHISGVLGRGNLKRSQKETSFHFYPDTGELVTKEYGIINCNDDTVATTAPEAESSSSQAQATQPTTACSASVWEWDQGQQMYRFYDHAIGQWVYNDEKAGYMKYWLNGQWVQKT